MSLQKLIPTVLKYVLRNVYQHKSELIQPDWISQKYTKIYKFVHTWHLMMMQSLQNIRACRGWGGRERDSWPCPRVKPKNLPNDSYSLKKWLQGCEPHTQVNNTESCSHTFIHTYIIHTSYMNMASYLRGIIFIS